MSAIDDDLAFDDILSRKPGRMSVRFLKILDPSVEGVEILAITAYKFVRPTHMIYHISNNSIKVCM